VVAVAVEFGILHLLTPAAKAVMAPFFYIGQKDINYEMGMD
jgi:hypothetical protein